MDIEVIQTLKHVLGQAQCPDTESARRVLNAHIALDKELEQWATRTAIHVEPTIEQLSSGQLPTNDLTSLPEAATL